MRGQPTSRLRRLEFPTRGVSRNYALDSQPAGTTRHARNFRAIDDATGLTRGAKRPPTKRLTNSGPMQADTPIKDIGETVYELPRIHFSNASTPSLEWQAETAEGGGLVVTQADTSGDVYAIDGSARLCVFNASGTLTKTEQIPRVTDQQIVRTLFVDPSTGLIFVAVSDGGVEADARLWAYRRDNDEVVSLVYTFSPGAYVDVVRTRPGFLYLLIGSPSTGRSTVVCYSGYTLNPVERWRRGVAHRAQGLDVRQTDGAFAVCAPYNANRGKDPRYNSSAYVLPEAGEQWTAEANLRDYSARAFCRLQARSLSALDNESRVTQLVDDTGNGRSLVSIFSSTEGDPLLRKGFLYGQDVLDFNERLLMRGAVPTNTQSENAQKAVIPISPTGAFALIITFRLSYTGVSGTYAIFNRGFHIDTPSVLVSYGNVAILYHVVSDTDQRIRIRSIDGWHFDYQIVDPTTDDGVFVVSIVGAGRSNAASQNVVIRVNGTPLTSYRPFVDIPSSGVSVPLGPGVPIQFSVYNETLLGGAIKGPYSYLKVNYTGVTNWFAATLGKATAGDSGSGGTNWGWAEGADFEFCELLTLRATSESYLGASVPITAPNYPNVPYDPLAAPTEIEILEGWLMWRIASGYKLDEGTVSGYPHPFTLRPPNSSGLPDDAFYSTLIPEQIVSFYDKDRALAWSLTSDVPPVGPAIYRGGLGYAVAFSVDGDYLYTYGPTDRAGSPGGAEDGSCLRKLAATDGAEQWKRDVELGLPIGYDYPNIAVDAFDNVWIPRNYPGEVGGDNALWGVDKDGADIALVAISGLRGLSVALPPSNPDYSQNPTTITRPEFVYVATNEGSPGGPVLHKVRVVNALSVPDSTRIRIVTTVTAGNIRRFGSPSTITGGEGALSPTARYIQGATLFSERFYTDGQKSVVFNPAQGTVVPYRARSTGEVPQRFQLIEAWRGAIMVARMENDPHNWALSRRTKPYDWNYRLSPTTSDMAVIGSNSRVGICPDAITCLIPWNDDLCIIGGDRSAWRMTGDPLTPNSALDDLNLGYGLAFGRPYCRDGSGRLWVMNNQGSLCVATPSGGFRRMSQDSIERELQSINFNDYYVRLEWDPRQEGIYICVIPFGNVASEAKYFLYDIKNNGFWPDDRRNAGHRVHSMAILDGDRPQDRQMLFGCEDGHIRTWGGSLGYDDGDPIEAEVDLGPYSAGEMDAEILMLRLQATFDGRWQGAIVEGYASNSAVDLGAPVVAEYIQSGQPDNLPFRVSGRYAMVRIKNYDIGAHVALESVDVEVAAGGPRRNRK